MTTNQTALVIIAHGSRWDVANQEFFSMVKRIEELTDDYCCVVPALLEQAQPTMHMACASLPENIKKVDIYPLFFNRGRHIEKDIPMQVSEVMDSMPERQFRLLDYLGSSDALVTWVLNHLSQQSTDVTSSNAEV